MRDKPQEVVKTQLPGYAFSVGGWALDLSDKDVPQLDHPQIINARAPTSTSFTTASKKGLNSLRAPLQLGTRETGDVKDAGVERYLHVGWIVAGNALGGENGMKTKSDNAGKQKPVGLDTPPATDCIPFTPDNYDIPPLYVVMPMNIGTTEIQARLFVLAGVNDGLRTPHPVAQENVFYLHHYRDDTTVYRKRGPAWNALAQRLVRALNGQPENVVQTNRQKKYERARDTTRCIVEPNISLANEVTAIVSGYLDSNGSSWMLDVLIKLLEEADQHLQYWKQYPKETIKTFVLDEDPLTLSDASEMEREILEYWPNMGHVDARIIFVTSLVIKEQEVAIEYCDLRLFLTEIFYAFSESRWYDEVRSESFISQVEKSGGLDPLKIGITDTAMSDVDSLGDRPDVDSIGDTLDVDSVGDTPDTLRIIADIQATVMSVVKMVQRNVPEVNRPVIEESDRLLFMETLLVKLKEIQNAGRSFDTNLATAFGDRVTSAHPVTLWATYSQQFDVDSAKLAWSDVTSWFAQEMLERNNAIDSMLGEVIEILEQVVNARK